MSTEAEFNAEQGVESEPGRASAPLTAESGSDEPRYDFVVDPEGKTVHASVVRLVGRGKRVLELGPATGYLSQVFTERGCTVTAIEIDPKMAATAAQFCERMIVADIDRLDWEAELGDAKFDVIVAADVLEHLKDPLAVLRRLQGYLDDDGYFVASIPNVAHGSVRLALLQGRFPYQELGLLDRTHLRFLTRDTIEQLFYDADFLIGDYVRHDLPIDATEIPFDPAAVPPDVRVALEQDPDALTYQFVFKAYPSPRSGLRLLHERMAELAAAKEAAERRVQELERESLHSVAPLREGLVDAHDQLLKRDDSIRQLTDEVTRLHARDAEFNAKEEELRQLKEQLRRVEVRLDRLLTSPPLRLYARMRMLPGFRAVVARRTAGYERALRQSGEDR